MDHIPAYGLPADKRRSYHDIRFVSPSQQLSTRRGTDRIDGTGVCIHDIPTCKFSASALEWPLALGIGDTYLARDGYLVMRGRKAKRRQEGLGVGAG